MEQQPFNKRKRQDEESVACGPSLSSTIDALITQEATQIDAPKPYTPEESSSEDHKCEVQTLYEGPPKCQCCKNWVEEYPDDLRAAVEEQPDVKLKALIVRMRKNHGDGKPLVLDSIVVQSPLLKETLCEVFEGFSGITASLNKLVFKSPFHPFYYRWEHLERILERQKQEETRAAKFTQLLYDVLHTELHETMAEIKDHIKHRVITYPLLWALFEPGKIVVSEMENRFFIIHSCTYNSDGYVEVCSKFVDWDASRFGYRGQGICIGCFEGTRKINELSLFPIEFHPSREEAEELAVRRATTFQKFCGVHYMAHSGLVTIKYGQQQQKRHVDGRIIIDAESYFRANPGSQLVLAPLEIDSIAPKIHVADETHIEPNYHSRRGCVVGVNMDPTFESRRKSRKSASRELSPVAKKKAKKASELTREQLLLCNSMVRGFSLKLKDWCQIRVEDVYDITWNDNAFPSLMLPKGFKNLVLSFVEGQAANKTAFDDIIEGKGLGIVMLLAGNPGTGKTLTAEAVADKVKKPLYMLSAGELGKDASSVEKRLNEVLDLTEKWGAVLLFDECDVFIQERSKIDLAHNEIVAVFLRMLEYYRGILFMTSNRADTIDRAFKSRIHLTLQYPDLGKDAKSHIWRQFTRKSQSDTNLTDEDISSLAKLPLNGRQIKNVVKISTLLAGQENETLGIDQIRTVLEATGEVGNLHED
ncbi:hypothetical protein F5Y16DRAFT_419887 [Xylariaceae sp. FL0255]|nr:hypothetical protein F5Y16DRAFT_419887 [Xylariaceae sp. FL0255]